MVATLADLAYKSTKEGAGPHNPGHFFLQHNNETFTTKFSKLIQIEITQFSEKSKIKKKNFLISLTL